jgi:hypothetical protein
LPLQFSLSYETSLFVFQLIEQIIATSCALFDCDAVYKKHFEYLGNASVCFKKVSDINCENWGARKLATALKVVCCPEEEDYFHKVNHTNYFVLRPKIEVVIAFQEVNFS